MLRKLHPKDSGESPTERIGPPAVPGAIVAGGLQGDVR